jgi:predicted transcriptional regulator
MKLTRSQIAAIKRVAATVQPDLNKKYKKLKEIERLQNEIQEIDHNIAVWDQGIRNLTGVGIEELVEKETINGSTKYKVREDILEEEEETVQEPEQQGTVFNEENNSLFN